MMETKRFGIRRYIAFLLAAVIMAASIPVINSEAAGGLAIKAKFIDWGLREVAFRGETYPIYDCAVSYIGVDMNKFHPTAFQYQVFTQDGSRLLRQSKEIPTSDKSKYITSTDGQYLAVRVEGGRRTVLTSARVRIRINGKWSAWSGLVGLIPIHTFENVKLSYNGKNNSETISWSKFSGMQDYELYVSTSKTGPWKMVTRTVGTSYTLKSFNGKALKKKTDYYFKVIGRAKVGNTMTKAKGDSDTWYTMSFYIE